MPVIFQNWISESDLDLNPDVLYVFGDNYLRQGRGGVAKACRGKQNAVGVCTKKAPTMDPNAFLTDDEYDQNVDNIRSDFEEIYRKLAAGGTVVFPTAPLGSGLAEMDKRAPNTYKYLNDLVESLADHYT